MPTENRSSNTEMVSVPREHELKIRQTPLADLLSGLKTGEIRDCSDREFAVGDTVLLREIDDAREYTSTVLRRTITHVQKNYGLPDHLCVLSYGQPAEQHQGEPVSMPERMKARPFTTVDRGSPSYASGWNACLDEIAKLGPLYTRPVQGEPVIPGHRLDALDALVADGDPQSDANVSNANVAELIRAVRTLQVRTITRPADPGEVERLETLIGDIQELRLKTEAELEEVRAQLAAIRELKLPEFLKLSDEMRAAGDHAEQRAREDQCYSVPVLKAVFFEAAIQRWLDDQEEALSASAEPSAPKCKTCNGTGMVDDGEITCSEGGIPYENGPVKCVKDCPDCKPSAPVERDELMQLLRDMTYAYRGAIQAGYDRITSLGGDCDSVDKMLADFPAYAKARAALGRKTS